MTAVVPTVTCFLDDGSGTYPIDVSARVSLAKTVNVSGHGRTDELGVAAAASFTCTLQNNDGSVTGIGSAFGSGPFGGGPFGGTLPLYPGQGIRYIETLGATTVTQFTGKVSEIDLSFDGGPAVASSALVTAVDPLARLANWTLLSMGQEEILGAGVTAYYPLSEPTGAVSAADLVGQQRPLLLPSFAAPFTAFATDLGLPDGSTGVQFTEPASASNLELVADPGTWTSTSVFLSIVFAQNTPAATPLITLDFASGVGTPGLTFNGSGKALFNGCVSPSSVMDGLPHVISVQAGGGLSTDLWVDGLKVDTAATMTNTWANTFVALEAPFVAGIVTTFGHFTYGPRLSDTQVQGIQNALLPGLATETTDARLSRLASYVGMTATTVTPSGQLVGAQVTSGQSAADAMQAVALSEGGVLFVNGSGALVMQGRYYRSVKTTPDLTVPMKDISVSTTIPWDTQQLINSATVTRTGGSAQLVQDASAIDPNGPGLFQESLDLIVDTDDDALSRGLWDVSKHLETQPRIGSATVSLLTSSIAASLMQTEVGDRWALSGLPTQTWSGFGDQVVEGWSRTLTVTGSSAEWSMTVNLVPWQLDEVFILDDATYGILDSATPIGY